MPYIVKEKRRVTSLRRGTRVVRYLMDDVAETPLYVQKAETKTKYTYLDLGHELDGSTVYERVSFRNDEELDVLVEKLTDAEEFDRDYLRAQRWVSEKLDQALANVPADWLTKKAQEWRESAYYGHVLDWSDSTRFFQLQAEYHVARQLESSLVRLQELYGSDVSALSALALELHEREISRRNRSVPDPMSRSTSVMSNVIDDLDRWAWDKLADNARFYVSDDVREYELKRLSDLAVKRQVPETAGA